MLSAAKHLSAHRDRPEARAQGDKTLPILVGKIHYRPVAYQFIFINYWLSAYFVNIHYRQDVGSDWVNRPTCSPNRPH